MLDPASVTLELLRGGGFGTRADTKPGGMLGGLSKTCSSLRKGKLSTEDAAYIAFVEGMQERFNTHSRFILGSTKSNFAVKHYAGTVSYSSNQFVGKVMDLLDSEFVRLFRTASSESFLAKLFCGPSLAAESHPRDASVLVAAQVSAQPLRRLSPLKVSRTSSTSTPSEAIEADISPVSNQINEILTNILSSLNEITIWKIHCIRPNDNILPGVFDIRRVKSQIEAIELSNIVGRKRIEWAESFDFDAFDKRYPSLQSGPDSGKIVEALQQKGLTEKKDFVVGRKSVWLSFRAWQLLEGSLRVEEVKSFEGQRRATQLAEAQRTLESNSRVAKDSLGIKDPASLQGFDVDVKGSFYGDSSDDLVKNAGPGGGSDGSMPTLNYDAEFAPPKPGFRRMTGASSTPSLTAGLQGGSSEVWGPDWKGYSNQNALPNSPSFTGGLGTEKNGSKEKNGTTVQEIPTSQARRSWLMLVWVLTWWIPSFMLKYIGRMKRPDVRIAWREKVALCIIIALICCSIVGCIENLLTSTKANWFHTALSNSWARSRPVPSDE